MATPNTDNAAASTSRLAAAAAKAAANAASASTAAKGKKGVPKGTKRGPAAITWSDARLAALASLAAQHGGFFVRVMSGLISHPAFAGDDAAIAKLKSEEGPQVVRNRYNKLRAAALKEGYTEDQIPELSSGRGKKVNLEKILGAKPKGVRVDEEDVEDDDTEDDDTDA